MASAVPLNFMESLNRALADNPAPLHELDAFARNAIAVRARRIFTVPVLIDEFKSMVANFLMTYRNIDDADWLKPGWFFVGRVNVRALLLLVLEISCCTNAICRSSTAPGEGSIPISPRRWSTGI